MRKLKTKEIAFDMGISPATVSLALNNRAGVSEQTKLRVFEYVKNAQAKKQDPPAGAFVKLILFAATEHLKNYEERDLFNLGYVEISRLLQQKQIELRLVSVATKTELHEALMASEAEGAIGVLLEANELSDELRPMLSACPTPLVLYDCELYGEGWDVVNFHNKKAIFDGMRYLESNGHRDIVYLRNSVTIHNFSVRRKHYVQYCEEGPGRMPEIVNVGSAPEVICDCLTKYLQGRAKLPDALFLENFTVSIGALKALQKMGLSVPGDISLIGIDDLPTSTLQSVDLSRFSMPHRERSGQVVRQLLYRIEKDNRNASTEILLAPAFHTGQTVQQKV